MANKLKKATHKFVSNISIYGISRVLKAETFVAKLAWTLMIIASSAYGIINTADSLNDYYQNEVVTKVERIWPEKVTFPAVTVCFPSVLIKDYFENANANKEFKKELLFDFDLKPLVQEANFINSSSTNISVIDKLDYFSDTRMNSKCFKFNGDGLVEAENSFGNFHLKILREHNETDSSQSVVMSYLPIENYFVYVTDNSLNSILNQGPLTLRLNERTFITTEKTTVERKLGLPYNPCNKSEDYRRDNCIEKCINRLIGERRNCSIPSRYENRSLPRCEEITKTVFKSYVALNASEMEYINKAKLINYMANFEKPRTFAMEFYKECEGADKCPQECESTRFSFPIVIDNSKTSNGGTQLSVKLYDFSFLNITQIPKISSLELISNIGGTLSLFIGISFVSIVELFEFLIDLCIAMGMFSNK